jgi:hypothetical protein
MEEDDVGGTGSTRGGDVNRNKTLVRKYDGQRQFRKLKLRTEKKRQHYYSINNLCRFGLDSAGSEQGSKVEGITG